MILLSVYYTDKPGGFCKRLYRLFRALNAASHEVHYCALDLPPDEVREAVHFHKIPFWTTKRSGLPFWGTFLLWCPFFLAWTAWKVKPARYVVFGAFYSTVLTIARIVYPAPLVLFLRSLVFEIDRITGKPGWIRAISGSVERFGIRTADRVVSMTKSMEESAEEFVGGKLHRSAVLKNDLPQAVTGGPDIRELIATKHQKIAVTAGVLDERKNISLLIDAWRRATGVEKESWGLVIAGRGPCEEALKTQALGLHSVHFVGWVDNLASYLSSAQLVLHPSLHEGISNAVLEALAAGAAILTSDIPEHRELFPDDRLRCPPADWASRLSLIFHNPSELTSLQAAGAKAASDLQFDWDNCAVKLVAEFEK